MLKKVIAFLILFTVVMVSSPAHATTLFDDVTPKNSNYKEFKYLVDQGILQSNAEEAYGVKENATRAELAYLLAMSLKLELPTEITTSPYSDVLIDDKRLPYILAVAQQKIMSGNDNGQFMPDRPLTRAQTATILVSAFKLNGTTSKTFKDVPKSHSAYAAINTLVANEITSGFQNNEFKPTANVTKGQLVVFIARVLNPSFRQPINEEKFCVQETTKPKYYINVAVANLWHNYQAYRTLDTPSITNPVDYNKWIRSMNVSQKQWLVGRTDTQSLYNDEVTLIKSKGSMHYVAAKDQYVPYNKDGYPGWLGKQQITKSYLDTSDCEIAVITADKTTLLNEKNKQPFLQISYATILPVVKKENGYYHVQTPANGIKLLKASSAKVYKNYKAIPKPSQSDIVNTAKRFLGLKYLWAGTSSWGYDCSGIIYATYRAHGIMIPRDSFHQATKGKAIAKSQLKPGDLIFFGYNGGKGKVYHVGLYIGDGKMLHAPNYASQVKIERFDAGVYKRNYAGARRYL